MANLKASKTDLRKIQKRTLSNLKVRSRLKTVAKKVVQLRDSEDMVARKEIAKIYFSVLDRAAKGGIIHHNKANRLKSRTASLMVS